MSLTRGTFYEKRRKDTELKNGMKKGEKIRNWKTAKKFGIQKGANLRNLEIAKNLLQLGISIEQVMKATGLTKEKIEEIKKEI